jgi:hypothetical protein
LPGSDTDILMVIRQDPEWYTSVEAYRRGRDYFQLKQDDIEVTGMDVRKFAHTLAQGDWRSNLSLWTQPQVLSPMGVIFRERRADFLSRRMLNGMVSYARSMVQQAVNVYGGHGEFEPEARERFVKAKCRKALTQLFLMRPVLDAGVIVPELSPFALVSITQINKASHDEQHKHLQQLNVVLAERQAEVTASGIRDNVSQVLLDDALRQCLTMDMAALKAKAVAKAKEENPTLQEVLGAEEETVN